MGIPYSGPLVLLKEEQTFDGDVADSNEPAPTEDRPWEAARDEAWVLPPPVSSQSANWSMTQVLAEPPPRPEGVPTHRE